MLKKDRKKSIDVLKKLPPAVYARWNDGIIQLGGNEEPLIFLLQLVAASNLGNQSLTETDALAESIANSHQQASNRALESERETAANTATLVGMATSESSNAYAYISAKEAIKAYKKGDLNKALDMAVRSSIYLINAAREHQDERSHMAGKVSADIRHSAPLGSRAKHDEIRKAWASGKYTNRDRCAEEECGALGMSFSAARKALRNTPNAT